MKLYTTTIHDCQTWETILAGIFSDMEQAEAQGRIWVEGVSHHMASVLDRSVNADGSEAIYYGTSTERYTVYIDIYTLNEISY